MIASQHVHLIDHQIRLSLKKLIFILL